MFIGRGDLRQAELREAELVIKLDDEKRLRVEECEGYRKREERLLSEIAQAQQDIDLAKHHIENHRELETELLRQLHNALGRLRAAEEASVNQGVQNPRSEGMTSCFDNTEDEKQNEPERQSDVAIRLLITRLAVSDEELESER